MLRNIKLDLQMKMDAEVTCLLNIHVIPSINCK